MQPPSWPGPVEANAWADPEVETPGFEDPISVWGDVDPIVPLETTEDFTNYGPTSTGLSPVQVDVQQAAVNAEPAQKIRKQIPESLGKALKEFLDASKLEEVDVDNTFDRRGFLIDQGKQSRKLYNSLGSFRAFSSNKHLIKDKSAGITSQWKYWRPKHRWNRPAVLESESPSSSNKSTPTLPTKQFSNLELFDPMSPSPSPAPRSPNTEDMRQTPPIKQSPSSTTTPSPAVAARHITPQSLVTSPIQPTDSPISIKLLQPTRVPSGVSKRLEAQDLEESSTPSLTDSDNDDFGPMQAADVSAEHSFAGSLI